MKSIRSMSPVRIVQWTLGCMVGIFGLLPIPATAVPITFAFEARITEISAATVQSLFNQSFVVGDTVRGSYRFESTTPDANPGNPSAGSYPNALESFSFGLHGASASFQLPGLRGVDRGGDIRVFDNEDSYTVTSEMGYMTPSQWSAFQAQRAADMAAVVQHLRKNYTPEATRVIGVVCTGPGLWCDFRNSLSIPAGIVGGISIAGTYILKPMIQMPESDADDPFFVPGPPTNIALTGDGLPLTPPNFNLFSSPIFALDMEQLGLVGLRERLLTADLTSLTLTTSLPLFPNPDAPLDELPATLTNLSMPLLDEYLETQQLAVPEPSGLLLFSAGLFLVLVLTRYGTKISPKPV